MVVSRLLLAAILDKCAQEEGVRAVAPWQEAVRGFLPNPIWGVVCAMRSRSYPGVFRGMSGEKSCAFLCPPKQKV